VKRFLIAGLMLLGIAGGCGFDNTLREYLARSFWFPFAKRVGNFVKPNVPREDFAYAGTGESDGTGLDKLRDLYTQISQPTGWPELNNPDTNYEPVRAAIAAARMDSSLTATRKEEVELIDAKVELRAARDDPDALRKAEAKFKAFLRTAHDPVYQSEARGWLARVYYLLGDQTAAGKIYLDELNRAGSNLSVETVLNSLQITYGYDGGPELLEHLDEYFDTPEHAAFAIQLLTNPRWFPARSSEWNESNFRTDPAPKAYPRIKALLEKHSQVLAANTGTSSPALLGMRVALRMGDPAGAREIGDAVPARAAVRTEPDYLWMLGASRFLVRDYAAAEQPLVALWNSRRATKSEKRGAAYGLVGVYRKTGDMQGQLRYALTLMDVRSDPDWRPAIGNLDLDFGFEKLDLAMLLDAEASVSDLQRYTAENPGAAGINRIRYALGVRLAREDRYAEAAEAYDAAGAKLRADRMRQLASLYEPAARENADFESRYKFAVFLAANEERVYFNDRIWSGLQRYALMSERDSRLTRAERNKLLDQERDLKDSQEERWQAYLLLKDLIASAATPAQKRRAIVLALDCLRKISDRFGRAEEIQKNIRDLSRELRAAG
jgi:hypothetical protein